MKTGVDMGRDVMGDISAEPSMEDILSSIKRIIAEEGDTAQARPRRPQRVATTIVPDTAPDGDDNGHDEILELSDPMPPAKPRAVDSDTPRAPREAESRPMRDAEAPRAMREPEPIVSQQAAAASRGSLDTLSKLFVKPEPGSDGTLEGLVREMLRPMLAEWLDANLPDLVETLVAREIEKIVGQGR